MKRTVRTLILIVVLLLALAPIDAAALSRRHTVSPETIHVHDGDTFYTGSETIRLRGIDTPELGQPKAIEATRRLIALLHEGPVTIVPRAEDVYGRTVATVYVRGRDIARVLRAEGFAKPRPRTSRARFAKIERLFSVKSRRHRDKEVSWTPAGVNSSRGPVRRRSPGA